MAAYKNLRNQKPNLPFEVSSWKPWICLLHQQQQHNSVIREVIPYLILSSSCGTVVVVNLVQLYNKETEKKEVLFMVN